VLGYPIIYELSKDENPELPIHNRPVFNYSMKGIVAAFSGIRKREELVGILEKKIKFTCLTKKRHFYLYLFTDGARSLHSFHGRLHKERDEPSSDTLGLSSSVW
jgi:hypothetical protein